VILSFNNIVKILFLGKTSDDSFQKIAERVSPENGESLIELMGVDVHRTTIEIRKQKVHIQYWLADFNKEKSALLPYIKNLKMCLLLVTKVEDLEVVQEWATFLDSHTKIGSRKVLIQQMDSGLPEFTDVATAFTDAHQFPYCEARCDDSSGIEAVVRSTIIEIYTTTNFQQESK